jgi:hypothetical protein
MSALQAKHSRSSWSPPSPAKPRRSSSTNAIAYPLHHLEAEPALVAQPQGWPVEPVEHGTRCVVHLVRQHAILSLRLPGDACPPGGLMPVGMASLAPPNPKLDYGATSNTPTAPIS